MNENLEPQLGEQTEEQKTEEPKTEQAESVKEEMVGEKNNDARDNKWWAALGYLGVLCVLPLVLKKDSAFATFHAKQGLVLLVGWVLSWLPFGFVFGIIALVLSIMGIVNALSEKKEALPVIGELAEKIKL